MSRRRAPDPLETFAAMLRAQIGLELLLRSLPPGSTIDDARALHRKLKQQGRAPCTFLDRELGILRG
jgi:hypothetical protein